MAAEAPEIGGRQYHIMCGPGDVSRYVLLPGDPDRVGRISATWDSWREVARHREYVTHTGFYKGVPISATSTGIGGSSASIAVEELLRVGADTFIRVGTTGAIQPWVRIGDLVIASGAVRLDGASEEYVMREYPAAASYEVLLALVDAAEELGVRYHVGVVASTDTFYAGQGRPGYRGYINSRGRPLVDDLRSAGVLSFEMEAATILTMAGIYNARAGCVCAVIANRVTGDFEPDKGVEEAIMVANEAVSRLNTWDSRKKALGRKYFSPRLLSP